MQQAEQSNKRNTFSSHRENEQLRAYRPQKYNGHSSAGNHQPPSRKRRLVDPNQHIYQDDNSYIRGPPAAKRARCNYNNNNNINRNHHPQTHTNQNMKFRQHPNYAPNANHINHTNHFQRNQRTQAPKKKEIEQDFHRITQRMRQIDIGKASSEYKKYIAFIPKHKRKPGHPRTPNPRYKMPNKHWKSAIKRWRKALHAYDDVDINKNKNNAPGAELDTKTVKCVPPKDKKHVGKFCCEKCSEEFVKFDEWQNHREQCNGQRKEESECKQKENVKPKQDYDKEDEKEDDDDLDLFNLDEDIDLDFMQSTNHAKEKCDSVDEEKKEETLLMALNDVLNEDDDDLF